jgi:hypothetical protein
MNLLRHVVFIKGNLFLIQKLFILRLLDTIGSQIAFFLNFYRNLPQYPCCSIRTFQLIPYIYPALFYLEDTALLFPFLSESVKVRFLPRVDTFSSDMLFIVSKLRFVFFFGQKRPKTIVIGIIVHDDKN